MPHKKHCASQPPKDLSSTSVGRVGVFAAIVAAAIADGCGSGAKQAPIETPPPATEKAVPSDPLIAESYRAFSAAVRMGRDYLVYFNATGRHATHFTHSRELSLSESADGEQGGLAGWDVSVSDKLPPLPFKMSDFEAWRKTQMTELLNRADIKERLKTPDAGVLFSADGSVFLTVLLGDRIQMRQTDPVTPLVVQTD